MIYILVASIMTIECPGLSILHLLDPVIDRNDPGHDGLRPDALSNESTRKNGWADTR